jgi:hypothetical protein
MKTEHYEKIIRLRHKLDHQEYVNMKSMFAVILDILIEIGDDEHGFIPDGIAADNTHRRIIETDPEHKK